MNLVWKLLKENVNKAQFIGYLFANLLGMLIILVSLQCYFDISPIFNPQQKFLQKEYLTITKKVNLLNAFASNSVGFSSQELEGLRAKKFIRRVGEFTPSQFQVYASVSQRGHEFGTEMFFESVPDEFIDIKVDNWEFKSENDEIPIIVPKNYLDLYNFGFADSRDLPKITTGMAGAIPIDIVLYGNGERISRKGRIVGFSDRLNTILVPEPFMQWANQNFGSKNPMPSRVLLEVDNIADPDLLNYFAEKGYQVEGDKTATTRIASLLKILVSIVVIIGAIICILSLAVFVLSIYLLLEKNMDKLDKLRLLGYSKSMVSRPYTKIIVLVNISVLILSILGVFIAQSFYTKILSTIWSDFVSSSIIHSTWIGLLICLGCILINITILKNRIR